MHPARHRQCGLVDVQAVNGAAREQKNMKNNIRVLRAERRWTQADLAKQLGVSRNSVNAIENGKYDPSLPLAFKIARLFERTVEDIFEDDA